MADDIFLTENQIKKYTSSAAFSKKASALLLHQKQSWDFLSNNYADLDSARFKNFEFDGFSVKLQFNPGRMISTSAKVDKKSIAERKCFLCAEHLPSEQKGLQIKNYALLCNPYPIFPEHFTVPKLAHTPQRILENFSDQLFISRELAPGFTVFYNGPQCGASAPDHMHFQAGTKNYMEIDIDYENYLRDKSIEIYSGKNLFVFSVKNYLRNIFLLESSSLDALQLAFEKFYACYNEQSKSEDEPLLNVLSNFDDGLWRVVVIPREVHRPTYYFLESDEQILLSPASVDLGGVCITPREKDFERISKDLIVNIFKQVCLSDDKYKSLTTSYVSAMKS